MGIPAGLASAQRTQGRTEKSEQWVQVDPGVDSRGDPITLHEKEQCFVSKFPQDGLKLEKMV